MDLANLSHLLKGGNTFQHDWYFLLAIANLLNGNGGSTSSVNNTLVVSDGDKSTTLNKNAAVFFDQGCETSAVLGLQVRQVKFLGKALAVASLRIYNVKAGFF